ncbi:hypothetical protein TBLA_0G02500 [Henningerozyma blattae CBS 6284]|uniref:Uncharacterized protein n=1 Tax=Henningerozyma blattae (strain ATCC 34711 / CBS 6284 / DSM 70876 / NBRC 10599 / NRRL Y-10934 / UCD 77-7) TaxID=1071380 RepID=I2H737_HENB6|nr:hypothetical protein TBLA_0G02500 [Tetrapisispora blattae CBS 6284]CCH62189.1 hypothetical protein TBLA_0G02500 [Tetrapisispora blattae CBS 6284]
MSQNSSTIDNTSTKTNNTEDNKQLPKKRSLSSYLSNVTSRREELEKIAKKQQEEQEELIERRKRKEEENKLQQIKLKEELARKEKEEEEKELKLKKEEEKKEREKIIKEHDLLRRKELEQLEAQHKRHSIEDIQNISTSEALTPKSESPSIINNSNQLQSSNQYDKDVQYKEEEKSKSQAKILKKQLKYKEAISDIKQSLHKDHLTDSNTGIKIHEASEILENKKQASSLQKDKLPEKHTLHHSIDIKDNSKNIHDNKNINNSKNDQELKSNNDKMPATLSPVNVKVQANSAKHPSSDTNLKNEPNQNYNQVTNIDESKNMDISFSSPLSDKTFSVDRQDSAMEGTILRTELQSMLTEPKIEIELNTLNEDADEDDVASDAPTEPASPPRPRLGRLVRGDQLRNKNDNHTPTFDNSSDSELSDLEELNTIPHNITMITSRTTNERFKQPVTTRNKSSKYISSYPPNNAQKIKDVQKQQRRSVSAPIENSNKPHLKVPRLSGPKKTGNRDSAGRTKLQIACDKGKYDLAKKLLEENYDVNYQDNAGNTALHEAALNGYLDIVKLLIEYGADINLQSYELFKDTPLIDASSNGHLDVVKFLLNSGADPLIANAKGITAYDSIEITSDLEEDEKEIVKEIKNTLRNASKKWINSNLTSSRRGSDSKERSISLQNRLIDEGEDYEFFWTDITSKEGKEKLFNASKDGNFYYVGQYLENGGRPDAKCFIEAVKLGHSDIVNLFLAFGMQVNSSNKDGQTPLMIGVGRGNIPTVKLLLEAGANPNIKDKAGKNALYYAMNSVTGNVSKDEIQLLREITNTESTVVELSDSELKSTLKTSSNMHSDENNNTTDKKLDNNIQGHETSDKSSQRTKPSKIHTKLEDPLITNNNMHRKTSFQRTNERSNRETIESKQEYHKEEISDRSELNEDNIISTTIHNNTSDDNYSTSHHSKRKSHDDLASVVSRSPKRTHVESSPKLNKVREETAEEREERLRKEEEYFQKMQQIKKKREQELLQRIAVNEQKKEEEKEKQKQEEKQHLQELEKQKKEQLEKDKELAELQRKREMRSNYPIGLKVINFSTLDDYASFLPLYFNVQNNVRYVLDLQIMVIMKDLELLQKIKDGIIESIPLQQQQKEQQWTLLKFIFLYGGYYSQRTTSNLFKVNITKLDFNSRFEFEKEERTKFLQLPMHWIKWNDITFADETLRERLEEVMTETCVTTVSSKDLSKQNLRGNSNLSIDITDLPLKLRNRSDIKSVLKSAASPLW